jgi:hypothetical protein
MGDAATVMVREQCEGTIRTRRARQVQVLVLTVVNDRADEMRR